MWSFINQKPRPHLTFLNLKLKFKKRWLTKKVLQNKQQNITAIK